MNTRADKTQENKSQSVANSISQNQRSSESTFKFVDNRPEAIAHRKLQEMTNNSPQVSQLKAFQEMANSITYVKRSRNSQNHVDKKNQLLTADKNTVIQGKFTGTFGGILSALNPGALGVAGTYYNNLWNALNNSATEIAVENAPGMANFNPTNNTLNLKSQMLKELLEHRKSQALRPEVVADHIALITHELSHAHDSVILGNELKGEQETNNALDKIANVMSTELQAWEREARTRQRLLPQGTDDLLWDAWFNLEPNMLVNYQALQANRDTNEVVDRYYRYLRRELNLAYHGINIHNINEWFIAHGANIGAEATRLANALIGARDTI